MVTKLNNSRQKFTYKDYRIWPDDERWELIEGEAYNMTPAPNILHQSISMKLSSQFVLYSRNKECRVFAAPFDVLLGEDEENAESVVQPDLLIICDKEKLKSGKYCFGAPDLIIEILSPSTMKKDMREKYLLYQKYGVKEYWIVDPDSKDLGAYILQDNGKYEDPHIYKADEKVTPSIFPDLEIDLEMIFKE